MVALLCAGLTIRALTRQVWRYEMAEQAGRALAGRLAGRLQPPMGHTYRWRGSLAELRAMVYHLAEQADRRAEQSADSEATS